MLIEHFRKGYSFDTFAGAIEVNRDTLYEWVKKYPDFSDAKAKGTAIRNYLVESTFVDEAMNRNPDGPRKNPSLLVYWTKNTLGWSDNIKQEISESNEQPKTLIVNLNKDK